MKKLGKCIASLLMGVLPLSSFAQSEKVYNFATTGDGSTYAIENNGSLWAWGWNESGQLGINGGAVKVSTPQDISNNKKWKSVTSGQAYTFFIAEDGTLWTAGDNSKGVSGVGDGTAHKVLTQVGTDTDWASIAVTRFFGHSAFGIKTNGSLWAWGEGENGSLGFGNYKNVSTPKQVGTDTDWKKVTVGQYFTIALKNDGSLWGWGWNQRGQLFDNVAHVKFPTQLGTDKDWKEVFAVAEAVYGIKNDGSLWVWGYAENNTLGINDATLMQLNMPTKVSVVQGYVHAITGYTDLRVVLVSPDGTANGPRKVLAWGTNADGALGNGTGVAAENTDQITFTPTPVEVKIKEGVNIVSIAGGEGYTIAMDDKGKLWGWGKNRAGQLGDFCTDDQMTFVTSPIEAAVKGQGSQQSDVYRFTPQTIPASLKGARKIILEGTWGTSDFAALSSIIGNNSGFPPAGNTTLEEVDMSNAKIASSTSLYIPMGVSNFGMFQGCRALKTVLMPVPSECANFVNMKGAFQNCSALTGIDVSNCVNAKNFDDTFFGCSSLTFMNLSNCENITSSESMLDQCSAITEVILPANITLGKYTFGSCTSLKMINWSRYTGTTAPLFPRDLFQYVTDLKQITLLVSESAYSSFIADKNWSALNIKAMGGVGSIEADDEENCIKQVYSFDGRYLGGYENFENLPNGTYIIRKISGTKVSAEKVIKQN